MTHIEAMRQRIEGRSQVLERSVVDLQAKADTAMRVLPDPDDDEPRRRVLRFESLASIVPAPGGGWSGRGGGWVWLSRSTGSAALSSPAEWRVWAANVAVVDVGADTVTMVDGRTLRPVPRSWPAPPTGPCRYSPPPTIAGRRGRALGEPQEEAYVVVAGSGRVLLDDEVRDLRQWDVVRVAPEVVRAFEAGSDGLDLIAVVVPSPQTVTVCGGPLRGPTPQCRTTPSARASQLESGDRGVNDWRLPVRYTTGCRPRRPKRRQRSRPLPPACSLSGPTAATRRSRRRRTDRGLVVQRARYPGERG